MNFKELALVVFGASLAVGGASLPGCAPQEEDVAASSDHAVIGESDNEKVVRAYYAATRNSATAPSKADAAAIALAPIIADNAVLSAPSVQILKRVPEVRGKGDFIDSVAGAADLLGKAKVREILSRDDLVVARIDLPLPPKGEPLTQIEYFVVKNGKIERLDSYYDAVPFTKALPFIAIEKVKAKFGH